ncbi:AraC family transcriptional regulator [Paenibacillus sp. P36]|uniref:AraC family transcriptional regulator n=1 Tax=Paenibacillus sp. P36 TaxID=3342538 RepID=UPI0038B36A48
MNIQEHIKLWNHAAIKIMDIRHTKMKVGEELRSYQLPASGFLQSVCGTAMISLDGTTYELKPLHVLHGGKGMRMHIERTQENFEYYLVLYKAVISLPYRQDIQELMERNNPFHTQYGLEPYSPVSLLLKIQKMHQEWKLTNTLEQFHVKTLFYQFVHDLLWQQYTQRLPLKKPEIVSQAVYYMNEHYSDTITLESLAELLNCSPRHLSRLFQDRFGQSPLDYLIRIRMDIAKQLICTTDATIEEIAFGLGYQDRYYFSRLFKKYVGMSPNHFKDQNANAGSRPKRVLTMSESSIVARRGQSYINSDHDNHYQYKRRGVLLMTSMWKNPSVAVSLLLMFTLLLSACSSVPSTTGTNASTQKPLNTASVDAAASNNKGVANDASRTIVDDRGESIVLNKPAKTILTFPKPLAETAIAIAGDVKSVVGIHPASKSMISQRVLNKYYPTIKDINSSFTTDGGFVPNIEEVLNIKPDVVFQWNLGKPEYYESMVKAGVKVITIGWGPWDKEVATMKMLGAALGKEDRVEQLLANQEAAKTDVQQLVKDIPADKKARSLLISAIDGNKISVWGDSNFYHEIPGVKNVAYQEGVSKNTMQVNVEQILAWNPDFIVIHETAVGVNPSQIYDNPQLKELAAVKNKRVYKLPEFALMSHMASLTWYWYGAMAYPEQFAKLNIRDIVKEGYKFSYNISLTDDEVNQVLKMDANKDSKNYVEKFSKK